MAKDLTAVILAAGKGTRMKSDMPKVLHPVAGKPLIDHVLDAARVDRSLKICVVLGHKSDLVRAHLGDSVDTVLQEKLLGTADAVRSARNFLPPVGDVLILCGDTPLLRRETIRTFVRRHRAKSAVCTVLTAVVPDATGYGRMIREGNKVVAIREHNDASAREREVREINVGVYCFSAKSLREGLDLITLNPRKKEFYLTDIISVLAQRGERVEALQIADALEGLGVNSREDLAQCEYILRHRILGQWMRAGVTVVDPATTFIAPGVKIGQDTIIRPFTVIEKDVRIGKACVVGPFARLRPGTRLADHVEIGNFAEVSRTHMGEGCVMKHFSFLGDARVDRRVNIGAGTVTANYDGKNKNKTFIHERAFIGSDSILVAPVTVGRGAVTGAGCVVTRGTKVADGQIVVGVPARPVGGAK